MKTDCDVIRDLLPLYVDNVCSNSSREIVENHIISCKDCKNTLKKIADSEIDSEILKNVENVIENREKRQKRRSFAIATVISCVFLIPVIVCLIVNLVSSKSLDWFFIVFSSLLLASSFVIVPLVKNKNRFLYSTVSAFLCFVLLMLSVVLYTGGKWFFVVVLSVMFGLCVTLLPIVLSTKPIKEWINGYRALICFGADTVMYIAMFIAIGLYIKKEGFFFASFCFSLTPIIFAWLTMLAFRYLPIKTISKCGISVVLLDVFLFSYDSTVNILLYGKANEIFSLDNTYEYAIITIGFIIGLALFTVGFLLSRRKK